MADMSDDDLANNIEDKPKTESAGSKFLKKKMTTGNEEKQTVKKPKTSDMEPLKSRTFNKFTAQKSLGSGKSSALDKVAAFSDKFTTKKREVVRFSDSDLDMDFSMDSDLSSGYKVQEPIRKQDSIINQHQSKLVKQKSLTRPPLSPQSSSDSEFGKGGNKFIKKPSPAKVQNKPVEVQHEEQSKPVKEGLHLMHLLSVG